jgi:hypothetical protein
VEMIVKPHIVPVSFIKFFFFFAAATLLLRPDTNPSSAPLGGVREPGELLPDSPLQPGLPLGSAEVLCSHAAAKQRDRMQDQRHAEPTHVV